MSLYSKYLSKIKADESGPLVLADLLSSRIWNSKEFKFAPINKKLSYVPTMLSVEEKRFLNWIARYYYTGEGTIVDLGAFLGGSTIQLCDGVLNNERKIKKDKVVVSYDRFSLTEQMKNKYLYPETEKFEGSDVLPIVENYLKNYKDIVQINKGDFLKMESPNQPVEILFVDIAKSWELSNHIVQKFFPDLIPGKSLVIQQDMLHHNCPWICAVMFRLKDYFKFLSCTEENTALFINTNKVTPEIVKWVQADNFTYRDIINSIDHFIELFPYFKHKEILQELKNNCIRNPTANKAWTIKIK